MTIIMTSATSLQCQIVFFVNRGLWLIPSKTKNTKDEQRRRNTFNEIATIFIFGFTFWLAALFSSLLCTKLKKQIFFPATECNCMYYGVRTILWLHIYVRYTVMEHTFRQHNVSRLWSDGWTDGCEKEQVLQVAQFLIWHTDTHTRHSCVAQHASYHIPSLHSVTHIFTKG